mmetsp:Transcript_16049/g.25022  ORF Transcript_16049/g.25022 Transcript_16049/m.25022 type:complete len:808 (-) Transcript_16049:92-2515(-)
MPIANHSLQQPNGKNSSKRPHYDSYQPFHQANLAMQPLPYHIVGSSAAAPIEIGDDADNTNSNNASQLQLQSPNNPMANPVPNAAVSNLVAGSNTPASAGSNAAQHALQVHHGLLASMPPPQFLAAATAHNVNVNVNLNALPPAMLGVMANANANGGNAVNVAQAQAQAQQAQQQAQRMNVNTCNTNNNAASVLNHHARHVSTPTVRMNMNGGASVPVQQQPQAMPCITAGNPHHNHANNNPAPSSTTTTHSMKQQQHQHQRHQYQHQHQHQHQHQRGIVMPGMNQSMPPAAAVAAFHHQAHHRVAQRSNSAPASNIHNPSRQSIQATQQQQTSNAKRQRMSGNPSHHHSNSCSPTTLNTAGAAFGGTIQQIQGGKSHLQSKPHSQPPQSAASAMVKQPQKGPQEQTKMQPNLHQQQPGVSMKSKYQQQQKKQQKQSVPLMKNLNASSSAAPASNSIMKSTATTTPVAFTSSDKTAQKSAVSVTDSTAASTADNNGTNLKAPSSTATSKQTKSKKQENKAAPVAKGANTNAEGAKTSVSSTTVSTAKTSTMPAKATSNSSQKSAAKATTKSEKKSNKSDGKAASRSSKKKKSSSRSNNSHLHASDFPTMGSFADASVVRAVHEILAVFAISGGSYTHQQLLDLDLNCIKGLGSQAAFKLQSILECLVVTGVMNVVKGDDATKESSSARKYVFLRGVPLNPSLLQSDNFSMNSLRDDCSMRAISPRASALPLAQLGPSLQRVAEEIEDSKDRIEILKKELRAGMPNESDKDDAKANRDPVRPPKQLFASLLLDYPSLASDMVFSAALR